MCIRLEKPVLSMWLYSFIISHLSLGIQTYSLFQRQVYNVFLILYFFFIFLARFVLMFIPLASSPRTDTFACIDLISFSIAILHLDDLLTWSFPFPVFLILSSAVTDLAVAYMILFKETSGSGSLMFMTIKPVLLSSRIILSFASMIY